MLVVFQQGSFHVSFKNVFYFPIVSHVRWRYVVRQMKIEWETMFTTHQLTVTAS